MPKLFVEKTIEINAPAAKVWDVLTSPEHTSEWAPEFSGGAEFHIESDWNSGSPVLWKGQDGNVIVEGNVTALKPHTFLRFTVFDVRGEKPPVTEEDGITYELTEHAGKTTFRLLQGDFSYQLNKAGQASPRGSQGREKGLVPSEKVCSMSSGFEPSVTRSPMTRPSLAAKSEGRCRLVAC